MFFKHTSARVHAQTQRTQNTYTQVSATPTKAVTTEGPRTSVITTVLTTSLELLSRNCLGAAEKNGSHYFRAAPHL